MAAVNSTVLDPQVKDHLVLTFTELAKLIGLSSSCDLVDELLKCLVTPPQWSTLRINNIKYSIDEVTMAVNTSINKTYSDRGVNPFPRVVPHRVMDDVIVIPNVPQSVEPSCDEPRIIVGQLCGCAVLRGADVFGPGVVGAPRGLSKGDLVPVYADIEGRCLRGSRDYDGRVMFVGNGILQQDRRNWFEDKPRNGIAVKMTQPLYVSPSLDWQSSCDQPSCDQYYPQNLPSIVVSHVLDPRPRDTVLDMCGAPGGKTSHIATLMNDQGCVVAIDRNNSKVIKLRKTIGNFSLKSVHCYAYDSTKLSTQNTETATVSPPTLPAPPPYPPESFDKVLLDGPCSGLGQRPVLRYSLKLSEVASYQKYQRQLIKQGVTLLKKGGTLVYSTCSVAPQENEEQVKWILDQFPSLTLSKQEPTIGYPGLPTYGLSNEQCLKLQRFGPKNFYSMIFKDHVVSDDVASDCICFFIAKFVKENQ